MRRLARRFVVLAIILMVIVGMAMPKAFALEDENSAAATSLEEKAEKAKNKLVTAGNYWGWEAQVGKISKTAHSASFKVTLHNSKYVFGNITVKATNKKVTYKYGGTAYSLEAWKLNLKKYRVSTDIPLVLKKLAKAKATSLANYAKARGWNVTRTRTINGSKSATERLEFHNSNYQFKATVTLVRKDGKLQHGYTRDNNASTKSDIMNWLETYKASGQ